MEPNVPRLQPLVFVLRSSNISSQMPEKERGISPSHSWARVVFAISVTAIAVGGAYVFIRFIARLAS